MQIEALGCVGIGCVWGWLLGLFSRSQQGHRLVHIAILLGATLLLEVQTWLFYDWREVVIMLLGVGCGAGGHLIWLHRLKQRKLSN